jgi:hypothetical protein
LLVWTCRKGQSQLGDEALCFFHFGRVLIMKTIRKSQSIDLQFSSWNFIDKSYDNMDENETRWDSSKSWTMNEPKVVQDKMNSKKEANPKKGNRAMVVNGSQGSWAIVIKEVRQWALQGKIFTRIFLLYSSIHGPLLNSLMQIHVHCLNSDLTSFNTQFSFLTSAQFFCRLLHTWIVQVSHVTDTWPNKPNS